MKRYSPTIEKNLLKVWASASELDRVEGLNWYQSAHDYAEQLAVQYNVSVPTACGVIAAVSPGSEWERNKRDAAAVLKAFADGKRGTELPAVGSYGYKNILKAERCALGEDPNQVLGGLKVLNFYACILEPSKNGYVCIDRHAKSAAYGKLFGERAKSIKAGEYKWLYRHYMTCARKLGVLASAFQAVVWTVWRRLKGVLVPV
jgi:hypothetical protein